MNATCFHVCHEGHEQSGSSISTTSLNPASNLIQFLEVKAAVHAHKLNFHDLAGGHDTKSNTQLLILMLMQNTADRGC